MGYAYTKNGRTYWRCQCDCGNKIIISSCNLRTGNTKSCGCYRKEKTSERYIGRTDMSGKKNPNYNSNLTDKDRQNRKTVYEYNEWRKAVYERDNYTCQCCGKRGGKLAAHHLESYDNNPELRTSLENGITLCGEDKDCHGNFHHQYGYGSNTREQFEEFLLINLKKFRN